MNGVRSYLRSQKLRLLYTQVNIKECALVYARYLKGYKGADDYLKKQVQIIKEIDEIVYSLERKHIVTTNIEKVSSTKDLFMVVKEFAEYSLKISKLENEIKKSV